MEERPDWEDADREDEWDDEAGGGERKYTLSSAGREVLEVIGAIDGWLEKRPGPRLVIGEDDEVQDLLRVFLDSWRAGILHPLASAPLTLTELGLGLDTLSRGSLQEALAELRDARLLEARPGGGEEDVYAATDWMREAVGPLAVALRCEMRQAGDEMAPLTARDIETAFLLAVPLLEPPPGRSGYCRLLVDLPASGGRAAGAMIRVEGGRIASCATDLEGSADSWAMGSLTAWLEAVIEGDTTLLEFGGEADLAPTLLQSLHARLCAPRDG
jgi:DNA-binding HxlR family transcriptional regulator